MSQSVVRFAQMRIDEAEGEARRCADYIADMIGRGVEGTSAFSDTVAALDEALLASARWRAVQEAGLR